MTPTVDRTLAVFPKSLGSSGGFLGFEVEKDANPKKDGNISCIRAMHDDRLG